MKIVRSAVFLCLAVTMPLFAADTPKTAPAAGVETFTLDKAHSDASFRIRHMMSSVTGSFNDFDATINLDRANPARSTVDFTIQTASIDTRQENRDKHLRSADFFDVEKFPTITFRSKKIAAAGKDRYNVTGDLTMHGVTKEVTLPVTLNGFATDKRGTHVGFSVDTTLNRKDFGILWNRNLDEGGVLLGDDVNVSINIEAISAPKAQ